MESIDNTHDLRRNTSPVRKQIATQLAKKK